MCCITLFNWPSFRVYTSTFSDWFSQSVIDFMLGYRGTSVFIEFMQNLSSSDPRELLRLSKIREAAIDQACSIVVYSGERFLYGWTLLSPTELNSRIADKFEEKILLLVRHVGLLWYLVLIASI